MSAAALSIRFCRARDGARVAFARHGAGVPLVKAASWMTHLELDRHSVLWRHWFEDLGPGRSLVFYDGRGYGMSDRAPSALDLDAMVTDLEAVADACHLDRFPLLGFCHGGPIAMCFAARFPERVSALVLTGTYLRGRARRDGSETDRAERDLLLRLIDVGWGQDTPAFRQVFASKAIPAASAEVFSAFNALQRTSATPAMARSLTETFWNIDVTGIAPAIRCPTLVLHSLEDAVVPFDEGHRVAGAIPGARLVPLSSANHDLLGDEPAWQHFVQEVDAFLAESGAAQRAPVAEPLTRREAQILDRLARGLDNDEIAADLHLADKTVRNHISRIFGKLGVHSRARAIVRAREAGYGLSPRPRD